MNGDSEKLAIGYLEEIQKAVEFGDLQSIHINRVKTTNCKKSASGNALECKDVEEATVSFKIKLSHWTPLLRD